MAENAACVTDQHSSPLRAPKGQNKFSQNVVRHATVMSVRPPTGIEANRRNFGKLGRLRLEANDRAQASHGAPYLWNGGL